MLTKFIFRASLGLTLLVGVVINMWATEVRYQIVDLGPKTHAIRLNARGEVALTRNTGSKSYRAFLFSEGKSHEIPAPSETNSSAHDLNDDGQVVGSFTVGERKDLRLVPSGFRYHDGVFEDLSLATVMPIPLRDVLLVGNDGILVARPVEGRNLVMISGAKVTPLLPPAGFQGSDTFAFVDAKRIGPKGEILGRAESVMMGKMENHVQSSESRSRAVIFRDGGIEDADSLGGLSDINRHGQIVGSRRSKTNRSEAFFFDGKKRHNLGIPGNFENSSAMAINDAGVIVGTAETRRAGEPGMFYILSDSRAYIYNDGKWRDLNECVDFSDTPFTMLTTAVDINDRGQIIGQGIGPGGYRAYLLIPVSASELEAKP